MLPVTIDQETRESRVVERLYPLTEDGLDLLSEVDALPPPPLVPGFARDTIPCPPPDPNEWTSDEDPGW